MIKPNTEKDNHQLLATQKSFSNTQLFLHPFLSLSTNSFTRSITSLYDSHLYIYIYRYLLDYLRISSNDLSVKDFDLLTTFLFSKVDSKVINKPWHPDPKMPKSKKYQNRIVSKAGIVLGYTKRAKYRNRNTRYVYDIMIDFTGSYFANLSLIEQIELIYDLTSYWKPKCHRLDVAVDDYSRKQFPVGQMIGAYLEGNQFGFQVIDDNYLDIIDDKLVGTLGIGSRLSSLFIRIYTKHKYFVRWEAELKKNKAQKLFDKLFEIRRNKTDEVTYIRDVIEALDAACCF